VNGQRIVRSVIDSRPTIESLCLDPAWCVTPDMTVGDAYAHMTAKDYDLAPVDHQLGRAVLRPTLEPAPHDDPAIQYAVDLHTDQVCRLADPLMHALMLLRRFDQLVVGAPSGGVHVITSADLVLPTCSLTAFGTIVLLEQGLNRLFEQQGDIEGTAREVLGSGAVARIDRLIAERAKRNNQLPFVRSLSLEDRFDLLIKMPELRKRTSLSKTRAEHYRHCVQVIRDTIAHAGGLLDVRPDWRATLQDLEELDAFTLRVWACVEARDPAAPGP
jgi:hypothetical protein